MTIEIRELVIKTEIRSQSLLGKELFDQDLVKQIKQQVLTDCLRSIKQSLNKNSFNR